MWGAGAVSKCAGPTVDKDGLRSRLPHRYRRAIPRRAAAKDSEDACRLPTRRHTENGQRLKLGDGLWNSITARGTYKLHVADAIAGQVVTFATMRENGTPLIVAVRLKVEKERITEIETIVARSENGAKGLEAMGQPREAFSAVTPANDA